MKSISSIWLNEEPIFSGDQGELLWLHNKKGPFQREIANSIIALEFFKKGETAIHDRLIATLKGFDVRYLEVQGLDPNNNPFLFSTALASEESEMLDALRAKLLAPFEEKIGRTVYAAQQAVKIVIDFYE